MRNFVTCDCCAAATQYKCNIQKKNFSWKHTNRNFDTYFWPVFWLVLSNPASVERYRDRWTEDQNNLFLKCPDGKKLAPIDDFPRLFSATKKNRKKLLNLYRTKKMYSRCYKKQSYIIIFKQCAIFENTFVKVYI